MNQTRPRSLRVLLGVVSLVLAMPLLALAAGLGVLQVREARHALEAAALADARALLDQADRLVLQKLAALRRFAQDAAEQAPVARMAAFRAAMELHLTLLDPAGAPLADTRAEPLPEAARRAALALAQAGGIVSPLVEDPSSGGQALLVVEQSRTGLLVLALPPARLHEVLAAPTFAGRFDAARVPAVVDAEGRMVAPWRDDAEAIGRPIPDAARTALRASPNGLWSGQTPQGEAVLVAQASSASTGLAVVVGVAEAALWEPVWRATAILGAAMLGLIGLAVAASVMMARRIAAPVARLGEAAAALAEGRPPPRLATPIAEINAVAEAMADAAERRRAAEEQRDLLVRELHHRVKNLLTTAQSLATLSARTAREPAAFAAQFGARLRALARTHTMLLEEPEGVLALRRMVTEVVAPYRLGVGRISLSGPDLRLPADAALPLGMVLHELATNAAKYGALSVPEGQLEITWRVQPAEGAPLLVLSWVERDGPGIAAPPRREGFGSQLLRRALATLPGGRTEISWMPQGLSVRLTLALRGSEMGAPELAATS
jgi:two-component sensor histidine kinase